MIRTILAWVRDRRAVERWTPAETHREELHPRHRDELEDQR